MTLKIILTAILLQLVFLQLKADTRTCNVHDTTDSIALPQPGKSNGAFARNFSYMGIPLIVSGIIVKEQNTHFRTLRNRFEPNFHKRYDDYTQYVPLAATWGLKLAGIEGRSS